DRQRARGRDRGQRNSFLRLLHAVPIVTVAARTTRHMPCPARAMQAAERREIQVPELDAQAAAAAVAKSPAASRIASRYSRISRKQSSAAAGTSSMLPTPWPADHTFFQARVSWSRLSCLVPAVRSISAPVASIEGLRKLPCTPLIAAV